MDTLKQYLGSLEYDDERRARVNDLCIAGWVVTDVKEIDATVSGRPSAALVSLQRPLDPHHVYDMIRIPWGMQSRDTARRQLTEPEPPGYPEATDRVRLLVPAGTPFPSFEKLDLLGIPKSWVVWRVE